MTKPACDSMSNHRRPDSLAHNQTETRTRIADQRLRLGIGQCVDYDVLTSRTLTATDRGREVRSPP